MNARHFHTVYGILVIMLITLIDRIILYIAGCLMMDFNKIDGKQMIFLMTGLLMVSVFYYLNDFKKNPAEPAGYFVIILLAFPLKGLSCFLSLVLYSFTYKLDLIKS